MALPGQAFSKRVEGSAMQLADAAFGEPHQIGEDVEADTLEIMLLQDHALPRRQALDLYKEPLGEFVPRRTVIAVRLIPRYDRLLLVLHIEAGSLQHEAYGKTHRDRCQRLKRIGVGQADNVAGRK